MLFEIFNIYKLIVTITAQFIKKPFLYILKLILLLKNAYTTSLFIIMEFYFIFRVAYILCHMYI
ncbi:hypothetical protein [Plasmodium yoelii yoelii]|uniref:Uncharacterized protein n=1 Tax=Plasmodium yoelii yoelii TaxID=73239 RepID=Q7RCI4_PLAYO|nr:hypothetical protein [Plasmodium yoelii yoelii]